MPGGTLSSLVCGGNEEAAVQEIITACSKIKSLAGVRERIKGAVCRYREY